MSQAQRHFVGAAFERLPGLSGTGTLLRITRLNRYVPSDYRFAFGITVRRHDDLHALMTFSEKRKEQLAIALDVSEATRAGWDLSAWMPFLCDRSVLAVDYSFRYCPECLLVGYHSLLQQAPWLARCPWHGALLRTGCHRCGAHLRLDGRAGSWLGVCKCGHDHVDDRKALRGLAEPANVGGVCANYLAWAAQERKEATLLAPTPAMHSIAALASVVPLPREFWAMRPSPAQTRVHFVQPRPESEGRSGTEDATAIAIKLDSLVDSRRAMIEAPGRLGHRIAATACQLAHQLPPGSLSDGEMSLFLEPAGATAARDFVPAKRRSILEIRNLPLAQVGHRCYLDLHCLSKPSLGVAHQVFRWLGLEAGKALTEAQAQDVPVCVAAVGEILARSYAEGIRVVLGRHLPDLYRPGRNRPHLSEPWVLLRKQAGLPVKISVSWARLPYTPE